MYLNLYIYIYIYIYIYVYIYIYIYIYMYIYVYIYSTYVKILLHIQTNLMCGVILTRCFGQAMKVSTACDTIPTSDVSIGTATSP